MSSDTWPIVGYGVDIDDIYDYFDRDKIINILKEKHIEVPDPEHFEETIYNEYDDFAYFIASLDETGILEYAYDGDEKSFVLFAPYYPWQKRPDHNELKTREGVEKFIANILIKVCDISVNDIIRYIHYINTTGCG